MAITPTRMSTTEMAGKGLLDLPTDILSMLPEYFANIEDYTNFVSSCKSLRRWSGSCATPNTILRLAAAQSSTFFRPSPHFLVCATARQLGNWARESAKNEGLLQAKLKEGIDGLLDLVLEHCGLTMERIRQLHLMRFSTVNPVTNIIDQCVGEQWYAAEDFWNGGRSDAYTISSDPPVTFFHLAIYGELFAPDIDYWIDPSSKDTIKRPLSVNTRLEYIKYCLPDFACELSKPWEQLLAREQVDPRRAVLHTGPYMELDEDGRRKHQPYNHNLALTWVIKSSRWRPHWKEARSHFGGDFKDEFEDDWWSDTYAREGDEWRQLLWKNACICQGLEGMGMIRAGLREPWMEKMKRLRNAIAEIETGEEKVWVQTQATTTVPYLLGDLRVCVSGYVGGT